MKVKVISLFGLFLLFLPFTQALTINIGFPLKFSELILGFLIVIFSAKIISQKKITSDISEIDLLLILFSIWAILSFLINSFWSYNYTLKDIPFRINPIGDSFLRLCYIILNISAFFISVHFLKNKMDILKYWVYGSIIASIYGWYLFVSSGLNLPYISLLGMEEYPQALNGFIRSGTFKEGNYFGLYLLLSAVISFYLKKKKIGFFLLLSIITTFSTISLISALAFAIFIFRRIFLSKKALIIFMISFPIIIVSGIYLLKTDYFHNYIFSKIAKSSKVLAPGNFSKVDRALTARIGYYQGIHNPILGVGPYNYGLHYDEYNDFKTHIVNNNAWSLRFFSRDNKRAIPNNIYIEVFAEYGFVGFVFFVLFLIKILIISLKKKNDIITGGIIALLISFNAFPSFIMLFIWVFFAIPVALKTVNEK